MSWVQPLVDRLVGAVPMELEQQELLRAALTPELERLAKMQEHFEAEATEYYCSILLWQGEARRLRKALADLSGYVEQMLTHAGWDSSVEELPDYVQEAMDALLPTSPKGE